MQKTRLSVSSSVLLITTGFFTGVVWSETLLFAGVDSQRYPDGFHLEAPKTKIEIEQMFPSPLDAEPYLDALPDKGKEELHLGQSGQFDLELIESLDQSLAEEELGLPTLDALLEDEVEVQQFLKQEISQAPLEAARTNELPNPFLAEVESPNNVKLEPKQILVEAEAQVTVKAEPAPEPVLLAVERPKAMVKPLPASSYYLDPVQLSFATRTYSYIPEAPLPASSYYLDPVQLSFATRTYSYIPEAPLPESSFFLDPYQLAFEIHRIAPNYLAKKEPIKAKDALQVKLEQLAKFGTTHSVISTKKTLKESPEVIKTIKKPALTVKPVVKNKLIAKSRIADQLALLDSEEDFWADLGVKRPSKAEIEVTESQKLDADKFPEFTRPIAKKEVSPKVLIEPVQTKTEPDETQLLAENTSVEMQPSDRALIEPIKETTQQAKQVLEKSVLSEAKIAAFKSLVEEFGSRIKLKPSNTEKMKAPSNEQVLTASHQETQTKPLQLAEAKATDEKINELTVPAKQPVEMASKPTVITEEAEATPKPTVIVEERGEAKPEQAELAQLRPEVKQAEQSALSSKTTQVAAAKPVGKLAKTIKKQQYKFCKTLNGNAKKCFDTYLEEQKGPELVVLPKSLPGGKQLAVTKYGISERQYEIYCLFSKQCPMSQSTAKPSAGPSNLPVALNFSDIEQSVDDYNKYCAITGRCPGTFKSNVNKPIFKVSYQQANDYAKWLSLQTGENYRLPTDAEWLYILHAGNDSLCGALHFDASQFGNAVMNRWGIVLEPNHTKEWVASKDGAATRGPVLSVKKQKSSSCLFDYTQHASNHYDAETTFRLIREIN